MRIQFLGTAAAEGWPALFCHCDNCERARKAKGRNYRTRSQVLINDNLLFDFGPDTFYHTMEFDVDLAKIETVLLTHSHTDHFYPTELILRAVPYAYDRDKNPMKIYGNEKCEAMFNNTLEKEDDSANLQKCVDFEQIKAFAPITDSNYDILPLKASHDLRENCMLYTIKDADGKRLFYGNDSGIFPEENLEHIKDLYFDVVSFDCTMGPNPGCFSHMGLSENIQMKEKMIELGCADHHTLFILTHFSHNGGATYDEFLEIAKKHGFEVAYDGMVVEI